MDMDTDGNVSMRKGDLVFFALASPSRRAILGRLGPGNESSGNWRFRQSDEDPEPDPFRSGATDDDAECVCFEDEDGGVSTGAAVGF